MYKRHSLSAAATSTWRFRRLFLRLRLPLRFRALRRTARCPISVSYTHLEAGAKFNEIVEKYGGEANFAMGGTSRVWAQPPYGTLKSIFPTPNAHLAYEICKGPRHFGGILTDAVSYTHLDVYKRQPAAAGCSTTATTP